ncbi:pyridoxamine 5'-phosphate oxidase family protein [Desmospora profundinema]|uniref:Pyridoxamine 5'-phosphate oxidase N-terminal domain-containing protein n=1 Tax=Desmospora profundinema TaxID=1571184 RepID=A0ABU1ILL4_9BACL|nr:pyridoxamine 5'-phosphate oxidase family protein [Desmospora profundinema]MDR6224849.1 hypothetical protein [Desmospora profundinema]
MAESIGKQLPELLLRKLKKEQYVLFATVDQETGAPQVNAVSWVYAADEKTIRIAVGHRSRMIGNVKAQPHVTITMIGPETTHAITGRARVTHEPLEGVTIKLACIEVEVETVRDVMFYGAKIAQEPIYEKTYDKEAADKLDRQVMAALQEA